MRVIQNSYEIKEPLEKVYLVPPASPPANNYSHWPNTSTTAVQAFSLEKTLHDNGLLSPEERLPHLAKINEAFTKGFRPGCHVYRVGHHNELMTDFPSDPNDSRLGKIVGYAARPSMFQDPESGALIIRCLPLLIRWGGSSKGRIPYAYLTVEVMLYDPAKPCGNAKTAVGDSEEVS